MKRAWSLVTTLFDDSARSKKLALRVRETNPTRGVRGPDKGIEKAKAYLYPSEFLKLVSCDEVPLLWRRVFACSIYLFMRASELFQVRREDIDMAHRTILIHRGWDEYRDEEKETKGKAARRFAIEPNLLPLLRVLLNEGGSDFRPRGRGRNVAIAVALILAIR